MHTKNETALTAAVALPDGRLMLELYPEFLLRSTGIPFDLLEPLRSAHALRSIEHYQTKQRALQDEQAIFLAYYWPQALERARICYPQPDPLLKPLYNINRQVRRLATIPPECFEIWHEFGASGWLQFWNELVAQVQQAEDCARAAYGEAARLGRQALHATFQRDQRLQEAVFLSNPGFFERTFRRWAENPYQPEPTKSMRQCETIAHRYLRRFTTKCEATAFFGPTLFARLDPTHPQAVSPGPTTNERLFVETGTGILEELTKLLSAQTSQEQLFARRNPLFREGANRRMIRVLDGRSRVLSPEALTLWRHCDGLHTLGEIACTLDLTQEQLSTLVQELKPFLVLRNEVPATEQLPLEYLWCYDEPHGPVQRLLALRDQYASTPWPQRRQYFAEAEAFCESLGFTARHGEGTHYADRTVFREDRSSPYNASLSIGEPAVTKMLETLKAVLPLCFVAALLQREDARESLRAASGGQAMPLIKLASMQIEDRGWRVRQLQEALTDELKKQVHERRPLQLCQEDIVRLLRPFWELIPRDDLLACLPGPDLMAAGSDLASAVWLLAELHDDASSIFGGNPAVLHPDRAGLWAQFQEAVVRLIDPEHMATITARRRSKHITPELPGVRIELSGRALPGAYETVSVAEALVEPDAAGVRIGQRLLHLYPGDLSSILHRALALPCVTPFCIDLGDFTPRIEIDGCVYQRARWRFALPESKSGFERWQRFHALREEYGLPERVYLRHPMEPKPFYIDFADPAAVEDLGRLPPAVVSVTEMLPGPGQLWWQPGGRAQCSEFRLGVLLRYEPS